MKFLDTNVILRFLKQDEPKKALACQRLFEKAIRGEEFLFTSALVIAEVVWTLEKYYKLPKKEVVSAVQKILNTKGIHFENEEALDTAIGLYAMKQVDFIDAYHAGLMMQEGIGTVFSYDKDFDAIPELTRVTP